MLHEQILLAIVEWIRTQAFWLYTFMNKRNTPKMAAKNNRIRCFNIALPTKNCWEEG